MKNQKNIISVLVALLFAFLPVFSQEVKAVSDEYIPIPVKKIDPVEHYKNRLEREKIKQREIETQIAKQKEEHEKISKDLVYIASKIRKNERKALNLENDLNRLSEEKLELESYLESNKALAGNIVLAISRIEQTPKTALLFSDIPVIDVARISLVMESSLPAMKNRIDKFVADINRLKEVEKEIQSKEKDLKAETEELLKERNELNISLEKRSSILSSMEKEKKQQNQIISDLAKNVNTVGELIKEIDRANKAFQAENINKTRSLGSIVVNKTKNKPRIYSDDDALSNTHLPAIGTIKISYGDIDDFGAKSEGLTIIGRKGGLIVSPASGTVKFAGRFKRYGNMVIIEHQGGYHSLISGFSRIDTKVGDSVQSKEPLGITGDSFDSNPSIYFELRHNGLPVNPANVLRIAG